MLLQSFRQFSDNPSALLAYLAAFGVAFVTGIAFHEFSHAWTANELGDDTAKRLGRVSLNPIRHLDPMGTVLLLLVGFGWGKPTPVNPYRLRNGVKRGNLMVAAAGPLSNFFFAGLAAMPLRFGLVQSIASFDSIQTASGKELIGLFLIFTMYFNVLLGVFNLIPIAPLDGFKVAVGILPGQLSAELDKLSHWGPGILMTLFVVGWIAPQYSVIGWITGTAGDFIFRVLL